MGVLDGARAVVTGGASGIGQATARALHREGASVAVLDLDEAGAATTAKEVDGHGFGVDVTDVAALERAVGHAAEAMGGLSVLFNNAGGSNMAGIHQWDPDEWDRIVRLNLGGVFHGMRVGAPLIVESGGGAIVSTASISGTRPAAGEAPYAAAKAAVAALTASAALEYAPTVRVNAVSPGMIHTGLTDILLTGFDWTVPHMEAKTPLARIGTPEDIADVVTFLCSDAARFITGQNLVVDGGMTLHGSGVDGLLDRFRAMVGPR
ncbi:MAG TPA: SDR family NAD(P)-dependent oxidoreductase [Acidimicrobiia bacterium]|nr:SDR family NAD(P)-dependent oxidoreductase [Acidimicrobiia bacterium]